jgi:mannose-1-phosphate guanylyltransferase/mannose-6-phosphate isomerase
LLAALHYVGDLALKVVILAGGSGTRLWPASTESCPKQFLDVDGEGALLLQTLRRCAQLGSDTDCFIITRKQYALQVAALMTAFNPMLNDHVILEPLPRNTMPAILLSAKYLEQYAGANPDDVMMVCPSDHLIRDNARLNQAFQLGKQLAREGSVVTFGIVPTHPETGYGYIKACTEINLSSDDTVQGFGVESFKEKPNLETAREYVQSGEYFWNAGIFAMTLNTLYQEIKTCFPEMAPYCALDYESLLARFAELPAISFDFAVMEKTSKAAVIPLDVPWSDVGSWDSVCDILEQDTAGNAIQGSVLMNDTENSLLINKTSRPMATIGMKNIIAVQTEDGLLIANRGTSQNVRLITDALRQAEQSQEEKPLAGLGV